MTKLRLQSSDERIYLVDVKVAKMSGTISTLLENLGMDEGQDDLIPLQNVNSFILEKVIEWATEHQNDKPPSEVDSSAEKSLDMSSWDTAFLKVDQSTLFELMLAANYLDIKGLLDLTCKYVASVIKGKTSDEIRSTFNIPNDFGIGEEEQIQKENGWCEVK